MRWHQFRDAGVVRDAQVDEGRQLACFVKERGYNTIWIFGGMPAQRLPRPGK
jgi:hypothetical protein